MRIGPWKITPIGIVLLSVLLIALILALVGSRVVQFFALVVLALTMAMLVAAGLSGGPWGFTGKDLQQRRDEFHPRDRAAEEATAAGREAVWEREKQLYDERNRPN